MKSAKEWAAEVVSGPDNGHAGASEIRRDVVLRDDEDYVMVYSASPTGGADQHCHGCVAEAELRDIIERLVERVQSDTRAPLAEEIARLSAENENMRSVVLAARNLCVMMDWDMNRPPGHASILVDAIEASGFGYDT